MYIGVIEPYPYMFGMGEKVFDVFDTMTISIWARD